MKKMFVFAIVSFVLLVFAVACGREQSTPSSDENGYISDNMLEFGSDTLTVYLPSIMPDPRAEQEALDYATEIVRAAGFNIRFERYNYSLSRLREKVQSGNQHAVYLAPRQDAFLLYQEGLLGDFYAEASRYAPMYMINAAHLHMPGRLFYMPTSFDVFPLRPTVYIRRDIFEAYGHRRITNTQEYEDLLLWIMERYPYASPGIYGTPFADRYAGVRQGYMALNLFLTRAGYTSLAGMLLQMTEAFNPLWMNNETGEIKAFFNIPEAVDAMLYLLQWRQSGLMEFWDGSEVGETFPTILVHNGFANFSDMGTNWQEYTVHIFHQPEVNLYEEMWYGGGAVAAPDTDVAEFLRFMEWLTVPENYRVFMYGVEDVDHVLNDYGVVVERLETPYIQWRGRLYFFNADLSDLVFNKCFFTQELSNAIASIPPPSLPLNQQERFDVGSALVNNRDYINAMEQLGRSMELLIDRIYFNPNITIEDARQQVIQTFETLRNIPGIDAAEILVNEMLR